MDLLRDQFLRLSKKFGRQDAHTSRTIANFVVLHFGDVDEDLGRGIIELNGFEDCGAIVGDIDVPRRARLKDLVHALGHKGRFDEISEREGPDERRETRVLGLFLGCLGRE